MKRKILNMMALVSVFTVISTSPAYAYRRVTIDRDNYASQLNRIDGCWLATARNFVVAQQPDNGADSTRTIKKQYNQVCESVKGTTADVPGDPQDLVDAMNEFDDILGNGSHYRDYDYSSGQKSFNFLFNEIDRYDNPVAIDLGPIPGSGGYTGHFVLLNGVDDGTNYTEFVRIYNNDEVTWMQYYDLEHGKSVDLDNRKWIATAWCD